MNQTTELKLTGLTCGHCVQRVKQCLEQREDVSTASVTRHTALITGTASPQALIATIEQAGYHAQFASPKSDPLPDAAPAQIPAAASLVETSPSVLQLMISGMNCASCVTRVQQILQNVPGVSQAQVNLVQRTAWITGSASLQNLISALQNAGYPAEELPDETHWRQRQQQATYREITRLAWQSALALLIGIPVMFWGMLDNAMILTADNRDTWLILGLITLLVMILTGQHYYRNAVKSLINRRATMDSLVALGTSAAWLYSMSVTLIPEFFPLAARHLYYEASLMIIGLINLGHLLETRGRSRSSKALEKLINLTPASASLITDNQETRIPLAQIQPGMILRLTPGERIPVDGKITHGNAWIDESMLTGEPGVQHRQPGDPLYAGTLVQDGSLLLCATLTGKATTLARIIQLVQQAQSSKPAIGRLADSISAVFVPLVLIIAALSGMLWWYIGPAPQIAYSLVVITSVLVIACPCALGLATPVSTIAGVSRAAEFGILVRDAEALQQASHLDTLVFDKTGTLTEGKPQISSIKTVPGILAQQALQFAAALETASSHPLAHAILEKADRQAIPTASHIRTHPGLGMTAIIQGEQWQLGSPGWFTQQQIDFSEFTSEMTSQAEQGATPVLLASGQKAIALFSIRDPIRQHSAAALDRLRQQGYRLIMLTGDNPITASAVARQLGISEVIAGVLPEGKASTISTLQQQGLHVAMIGDGINDAPALAQAQVGIAISSGSDIAMETASMTLMRPNLGAVADALAIAKATLSNIRQNLLGAFIYNIIAIPIAAGILWPLTGTLLNPIIAGAAMALSSITVVSNANRLLRFTPKP